MFLCFRENPYNLYKHRFSDGEVALRLSPRLIERESTSRGRPPHAQETLYPPQRTHTLERRWDMVLSFSFLPAWWETQRKTPWCLHRESSELTRKSQTLPCRRPYPEKGVWLSHREVSPVQCPPSRGTPAYHRALAARFNDQHPSVCLCWVGVGWETPSRRWFLGKF